MSIYSSIVVQRGREYGQAWGNNIQLQQRGGNIDLTIPVENR